MQCIDHNQNISPELGGNGPTFINKKKALSNSILLMDEVRLKCDRFTFAKT